MATAKPLQRFETLRNYRFKYITVRRIRDRCQKVTTFRASGARGRRLDSATRVSSLGSTGKQLMCRPSSGSLNISLTSDVSDAALYRLLLLD